MTSDKIALDLVDGSSVMTNNSGASAVVTKTMKSSEMYWCSDYHKCHAYTYGDNTICILYIAAIPTHTMRFVFSKEKHVSLQ